VRTGLRLHPLCGARWWRVRASAIGAALGVRAMVAAWMAHMRRDQDAGYAKRMMGGVFLR
jgi:hypothetical protein